MIDPALIARDFPSLHGRTYLNTAAEGIPPTAVGEALHRYWEDKLQGMDGRAAHFEAERACREVTARFIGVQENEVAFCSCSAEAYNLLSTALALEPENEVVLSDLDFPSGATPWLAARVRPKVRLWKSTGGELSLETLSPLLNEKTRLVQVSLVSFYNGYRLPWAPLRDMVRQRAPQAILSVDVTQALGRCVLDCGDADIVISSTHKWSMGIHGGGIAAIPARSAARLTARAGGWYNLENAFAENRFERAEIKPGAFSFATGMPSFAPIYALNAGLRYLETIGVKRIAAHADPLTERVHHGLVELGLTPMAPFHRENASGIVAIRHPQAEQMHARLHASKIHLMYNAGRLRVAVHGYNTADDIARLLHELREALTKLS
jgi:cysteine desulfurase / selenocysteine lyase